MALSQTISEAFVRISAKGLESVNAQFKHLSTATQKAKAQLEATAKSVNVIGSQARLQFGIATTAMIGFASAASPGDALKLEAAMGRLTVQIGSLFLPVIRAATDFVERLTKRLRELTPEQREQIGQWAKYGVAVLGVVGAGSMLLNLLPGLVSGIGAVGTAVKSLVSLIGLGSIAMTGWGAVILAVVAALGGLAAVSVLAAGKGEKVGAAFTKAWEKVKELAESIYTAVKPILAAVGSVVADVISRVADVVGRVAGMASKVWSAIGSIVQDLLPVFQDLAAEVMSVVDDIIEALMPVAEWFYTTLKDSLIELAPTIKSVLGGMVDFLKQAIREMRIMARVMAAIIDNPRKVLSIGTIYDDAKKDVDADDARRKAEREQEKNAPKSTPQASKPSGVQSVYRPELSSISDVLRKAQTAGMGESREMAMHRERIELQKQGNQAQAETRDAVKGLQLGLR